MLTEEAFKALEKGQRLQDTYGEIWLVACLWPMVGIRRGDMHYRTIEPGSPFRVMPEPERPQPPLRRLLRWLRGLFGA